MKRALTLILCLILLASCRPTAVTPPPVVEPPTPPAPHVELVRAVAVVGGKEYILYPNGPASTRLLPLDGEAVFEYSGPVDVDPGQGIIAVSGNTVRTHLIGSSRVARTPSNIRDKQGRPLKSHEFYLERVSYAPVRAYWISGQLSEELIVEAPWTLIMPGEAIKLEFATEPDQPLMAEQLASTLGPGVKYNLTWPDKKTLLLELSSTQETEFSLRLNETHYFGFYVTTPQKLAVLDRDRKVLSTTDVPISTTSAISLTPDFRHARLTRRVTLGWLHVGIQEYRLELGTGNTKPGKLHSRGTWYADEILLDWIDKTQAASKTALHSPAGLSNSGDLLALYEHDGKMKLIELATNTTRTIAIQFWPKPDFDFPQPHRVYWSHDDRYLYYTVAHSPDHVSWLHRLDLSTDTETALLKDHTVRTISPHSHHLFTSMWEQQGQAYFMVDGSGKATKLSEPGEYVEVTKWLDSKRVLINKSASPSQSTKCYIYHLDENRWEYICDGFGFDYDLSTDRVFVLQNR